ncbi:MAG: YfiR family protein [Rhizomicrobium sp.]|jgi:hypothetical protein
MAILSGWSRCAARIAGFILIVPLAGTAHADNAALEAAIKAAYVPKLAPFVTWPAQEKADGAFDLCVSGSDEVTKLLPQSAAGQQVNGRAIQVRQLADGADTQGCQILYVANSPATPQMLAAVRGKPVLTVIDGVQSAHGIVQFVVVQDHVRFNIDNGLATAAGLAISSKLLGLANAVTPGPQDKP